MDSYNNYYGNIVYSRLSKRLPVSELIMGIAMTDTSVDQREKYRTVLHVYHDATNNIAQCVHNGR